MRSSFAAALVSMAALSCGGGSAAQGKVEGGAPDAGGEKTVEWIEAGEAGKAGDATSQGDAPNDASSDADAMACQVCIPGVGTCAPTLPCTAASPCTRKAGGTTTMLTTILTLPVCATSNTARPMFNDGPPLTWTDPVNGDPRAACVYRPPGISAASTRPLVVFLHGGGGSADLVYDLTSLRSKAVTFDLSGDSARPGFVLVANQGRNLPDPNGAGPGARCDVYFRNVADPAANPDVRALDHEIDAQVALGGVDPTRIYVTGWSNGAFFGAEYTFFRHTHPTPGGNRIAAAAVYAGGDPFQAISATEPQCALLDIPKPAPPLYDIHRSCDSFVPCDLAQFTQFGRSPGYDVETWIARLQGPLGGMTTTKDVIISTTAALATACVPAAMCAQGPGGLNHSHWPDGVADGSGVDWEPDMLKFLGSYVSQ
jgi:predicted esterase